MRSSTRESTATSAPRSRVSCRFASLEAVAITRPAPQSLASWIARLPTPPAPACTTTVSPACRWVLVRSRCQAVAPWTRVVSAWASETSSGTSNSSSGSAAIFSRVAAGADEADEPAAGLVAHDRLGAGYQREGLLGEVGILGLVGVGVVDAGREHVEDALAGLRFRIGQVPDDEGLGAAELGDLDGAHEPTVRGETKRPWDRRERIR